MRFNITTEYDLVPSTAVTMYMEMNETSWANAAQQNLYQFANSNNAQNPAMWWAESLMYISLPRKLFQSAHCLQVFQLGNFG